MSSLRHAVALFDRGMRRRHEERQKDQSHHARGAVVGISTPDKIDTPLDHNSMRDAGSGLGCGVVRLIGEGTCIVEEVIKISEFFTVESCGQCPACRMETNTLTSLLKKVQAGQGGQPILEQFGKISPSTKAKAFAISSPCPVRPLKARSNFSPRISQRTSHRQVPGKLDSRTTRSFSA